MIIIGKILLVISGLFYALGGLGLFRMPDVYNRAQAGTKATTLGTFSALIGVCFFFPAWTPKLLLILVFVAITNPVGSSTLLRSAYKHGIKPEQVRVDALETYYEKEV
jgi:multicomponent Na+:H+ antiporter subunit G